MNPLYGALVVPHLPAQAALRLRPQLAARPVVLLEGIRPSERLVSANPTALALGLSLGMTRVEVESFPSIHILPRALDEERTATNILHEALSLFTPRTEACPFAGPNLECLLDLTGLERLLGEPSQLGRKLLEHLAALGFTASIALCENSDAALSLARAAHQPVTVAPFGRLAQVLAPLSVHVLNLPPEEQERFASWGIHTLGELAALPEHALIARLGQAGKRLLQRASGVLPHLLQPAEPAFSLAELLDFDDPIETLEPLLFCLNPMLEQLLLRAQSRSLALAAVTITLTLYSPSDRALDAEALSSQPAQSFSRTIRPAVSTLDRPLLLKMLQLDLEANPPSGAIVRLHLAAEPGPSSRIQLGLFAPPMPEPTRFEDTHARLVSLVGASNIGRLRPLDTHASDSFTLERFKLPLAASAAALPALVDFRPTSALRRLRPPAPIFVVHDQDSALRSFHFESRRFQVLRSFGPWRSSGDWWSLTRWSSDTWDIAAQPDGQAEEELLLCVVAHDLLLDRWNLEAVYD